VLPEPTYAMTEKIEGQVVGGIVICKSEVGPSCVFQVSNRYAEKRREIRLHGSKGVLVLPDDLSGEVNYIKGGGAILADQVEVYNFEKKPALLTELTAFIEALESDNFTELCSVEDGFQVVSFIDKIRELI